MYKKILMIWIILIGSFSLASCKSADESFLDQHMPYILYSLLISSWDYSIEDEQLEITGFEYTYSTSILKSTDAILGYTESEMEVLVFYLSYVSGKLIPSGLYGIASFGILNGEERMSVLPLSDDRDDYEERVSEIVETNIDTDIETRIIENIISGSLTDREISKYLNGAIKLKEEIDSNHSK